MAIEDIWRAWSRSTLVLTLVKGNALRIAAFLLLILQGSIAAFAGTPAGYTKRLYQIRDGLPEQVVQAVAQTQDRYLWVGTTGGLLRFDGAKFVLFDHDNTPELQENSIFCLLAARSGDLWIGTDGGGLVLYRKGAFHLYSAKEGLSDGFVRAMAEDTHGGIWIGTDNGLFHLNDGHIERIDGRRSVPQIAVHAILQDREGRLWVGGSKLISLQGDRVIEYRLSGKYSESRVKSILESKDGAIWVGTVSGLHRLDRSGTFRKIDTVKGTVRTMCETSDGALWTGSIGHGIIVHRDNITSPLLAPDSLPSNTVLSIFEDAENNVWVGTQAGLLRLSRTPVSVVPLPGATDSDFGTIYQDHDDDLWVASTHLFRVHAGKISSYVFPGMEGEHVRNVFQDRDGSVWLGTDGSGVFRVTGSRLEHYTLKQGLVNNFIRVFLQSHDGGVWIGTDEGVSHWNGRQFHNYQVRDGLCHFSIRSLEEDTHGDLWIGTDHGLSHLRNGKFEHDAATEALKQEKVWTIHRDPDGHLWFGTRNNGLYRFDLGQVTHYTSADGLASNSIYQILEGAEGNFWMSGPGGISLLNRHELDLLATHPGRKLSLTFYGFSDQAEATEIYGGTQSAGWIGKRGDVWFPSNRGPIHILSSRGEQREAPPVVVGQVAIDGRVMTAGDQVVLGPASSRLDVLYSPIMLGSQEGIRCRYKLDGFENWSEASTRRVAYYTNLSPGRYVFRVEVFDVNTPWRVSEASLVIIKKPHFYRTYWFVGLCCLAVASLVLGVYRLRLQQLRQRFKIVLTERGRLAREMHDTVIQGCTGVSALLEALSRMETSAASELQRQLLDCARTQMRSTIEDAREAVWNLRRGDASANDFSQLASQRAEIVSAESGIPIDCRISGKVFDLNRSVSHELAMILREGLHNAVVHGSPSQIALSIDFGAENLTVRIHDNGAGFDASIAAAPPPGHYGVIGMRERARKIGGTLEIESSVGAGTMLVIEVSRDASMVMNQELSIG